MASAGLDSPITVKVNFEGTTRRTKMPLREMVPGVLENNLRTFLLIPAEAETIFERYSDSAACFVRLTPGNIPVYKQLYRAAKAKSKLKIRVAIREPAAMGVPQPAATESEAEASSSSPTIETPTEDKSRETSPPIVAESSPLPKPEAEVPAPAAACDPTTPAYEFNLPLRRRGCPRPAAMPNYLASIPVEGCFEKMEKMMRSQHVDAATAPSPFPSAAHTVSCPATGANFAVCCNNCEQTIPDSHYHCSTCDDGDFDLCLLCVSQGVTCNDGSHWLIKRNIIEGRLVQSTTHTLPPRVLPPKVSTPPVEEPALVEEQPKEAVVEENTELVLEETEDDEEHIDETASTKSQAVDFNVFPKPTYENLPPRWATLGNMRTCNCCVQELAEREFLHCTTCEDFDLCQSCFAKENHGHHPKHGFAPAVEGTVLPESITAKMNPGRNLMHAAICDGCDKYIFGVRNKCLDCPDWDYCSDCMRNAKLIHEGHRFVPIYEHLSDVRVRAAPVVHAGICCDGPLCSEDPYPSYIRGVRYKCAVCHDFDLCANCEASPSNNHNHTHPLIKFRTPVRHVSVTTTGEHPNGEKMPTMGDRTCKVRKQASVSRGNSINQVETVIDVRPTEACPTGVQVFTPTVPKGNSINPVETVIDLKPTEACPTGVQVVCPSPPKEEVKKVEPFRAPYNEKGLHATFQRDTVVDGTILPPNHVFEQTWTLRNEGKVAWPAGCSVKFVGGDYMGHVDSNHPAGISELVSASESTVCYAPLAPGQDFPFTVLLRTPSRPGRIISYWRLTTADGYKFGHRLWCDVNVRLVKESEIRASPRPVKDEEEINEDTKMAEDSVASSQMVFPKLEKESPVASVHMSEPEPTNPEPEPKAEESDSMDEWDPSDDGFLTDEEYDILDASDEEFLQEQKKKIGKK